ncbi:hypothetical protein JK364_23675 [Streptomyces sp. 110]|uniref:Uncharacterized protein n=1 Tax=Streptomyces endocoffeicus TaxID=2898945 RepID=A0ABS1PTL7_9ACTN|nr:hypothetical protein [Streptomyces endocoffeicus]MBL1115374.1 hypothetical protein [Streptomyces endocoffeicus]
MSGETTEPRVHSFASTMEAYNATQCYEEIRDGDVLLIESEKVIGIASTWPFALTESFGELHVTTANPRTNQDGIFAAGVDLGEQLARERGWRIVPPLDVNMARAFMAEYPRCGEPIGFKPLSWESESGRERAGWLVAGTTGFIELDTYGHIRVASTWSPLINEK